MLKALILTLALALTPGTLMRVDDLAPETMEHGSSPVLWMTDEGETRFSIFVHPDGSQRIETYDLEKNLITQTPIAHRGIVKFFTENNRALMVIGSAQANRATVVDLKHQTQWSVDFPYSYRPAGEEFFHVTGDYNGEPALIWTYRNPEGPKATKVIGYGLDSQTKLFEAEIPGDQSFYGHSLFEQNAEHYLTAAFQAHQDDTYKLITFKLSQNSEIIKTREQTSCNVRRLAQSSVQIDGRPHLALPGAPGCRMRDAQDPRFDGENGLDLVLIDPMTLEIHSLIDLAYFPSCAGGCIDKIQVFENRGQPFVLVNPSEPHQRGSQLVNVIEHTSQRIDGLWVVKQASEDAIGIGAVNRDRTGLRVHNLSTGEIKLYEKGPDLRWANYSVSGEKVLIASTFWVFSPRESGFHFIRAH